MNTSNVPPRPKRPRRAKRNRTELEGLAREHGCLFRKRYAGEVGRYDLFLLNGSDTVIPEYVTLAEIEDYLVAVARSNPAGRAGG